MRDDYSLAWIIAGVFVALVGVGVWLPWWLAERLSGAEPVPGGPIAVVKALVSGEPAWPVAATWWAAAFTVVLVVMMVLLVWRLPGRHVDRAAKRLPRDRGLRRYVKGTGPRIGRVISGQLLTIRRRMVRATNEDQIVVIAGPRTGKTSALAIPAATEHPEGPLVVTSNKRDIYDTISGVRAEQGTVWLFDPQSLASSSGAAQWWWNPLTMCGDVRGARRLANIWAEADQDPGTRSDAYFEPEGTELLASMLLAAARGGHKVSKIYEWLAEPNDPSPVDVLANAPGCELMAAGLQGRQDLPEKQRSGIYGTAGKIVSWLADPVVRAWVEPSGGLAEFSPEAFADSNDTLVSLSKEGEGSATPLVTALTAGVLLAAEHQAAQSPGGRLERPMLGVLDEAANVCRWKDLPDLYSHYGSRGIVLMSMFQSPAQMVEGFGKEGAEKLWSAANVRVYGGGVTDTQWLRQLSDLAGEWDAPQFSHSSSARMGVQRSRSTQRRPIYDIASLGAMPPGRALVLLSAARPVLVELERWFEGPHADRIRSAMSTSSSAAVAEAVAADGTEVIR